MVSLDEEQAAERDLEAGLLADLADERVLEGLSVVDAAAGEQVVDRCAGLVPNEHDPAVEHDERGDANARAAQTPVLPKPPSPRAVVVELVDLDDLDALDALDDELGDLVAAGDRDGRVRDRG